jgi:hypothetical protein
MKYHENLTEAPKKLAILNVYRLDFPITVPELMRYSQPLTGKGSELANTPPSTENRYKQNSASINTSKTSTA